MSGDDDSLLARWSRRKQAVRAAEAPAAGHQGVPEDAAAAGSMGSAEAPAPVREDAAPDAPAEPLPSIEELTAESDVTAFLRKGVPEALKRAALRKVWALDPAIRDHVGPADYAWDFNDPATIPGFGGATAGAVEKLAVLAAGDGGAPPRRADAPAVSGEIPSPPRGETGAGPQDRLGQGPSKPDLGMGDPSAGPSAQGEGGSVDASAAGEQSPSPRPRHGGAMPR